MKAVILKHYGEPEDLEIGEVSQPVPGDDRVLVQVRAASVNDWDWSMVRGSPGYIRLFCGLKKPKIQIPGVDVAGQVVEVGRAVTDLKIGDSVYGDLSMSGFGAFAEYVAAPLSALTKIPAGMSFVQAASMPHAAALAYQGLHTIGGLQSGQSLLINGAGGGVGTLGVQMAAAIGVQAVGVDSASKAAAMHDLGFGRTIDYAVDDFTADGSTYDLILDTKTNRSPMRYLNALKPGGTYVTVGGMTARLIQTMLLSPLIKRTAGKQIRLLNLKPNEGIHQVNELFATGHLKAVIDNVYSLDEVPQAITRFGSGSHIGKVVIDIFEGSESA